MLQNLKKYKGLDYMLLIIDNYDSFTYNLVQYFGELVDEVCVYRNDEITLETIAALNPQQIVLSPGPCTPNEAGISLATIARFSGKIPLLGVCLGHQAIGQVFGARVVHAQRPMHGKVSEIHHTSQGIFRGLSSPFSGARYHSLVLERQTLPRCLSVTAWTEDREIMGICHKSLSVYGVQFHPEALLTEQGYALLQNFIERAA